MTAPQEEALPPLPEPKYLLDTGGGWMAPTKGYTADQMREYARHAAAELVSARVVLEPPELPPLSDAHRQLMKFYGVITLRALVNAQAHHIEKLQAKLPPTPNVFAPQRVREG